MSYKTRSDQNKAKRRRMAVKLFRSGTPAAEVARQFHRSRSWVYKWVRYRALHPWTRFRSAPRASHHHPNRLSAKSERRSIKDPQDEIEQAVITEFAFGATPGHGQMGQDKLIELGFRELYGNGRGRGLFGRHGHDGMALGSKP